MSDLPGDTTKQTCVAPAITMRSSRYSLTARGRSTSASNRLPTGRSSLEKASGWMRLPAPAAGTIPHISALHRFRGEAREHRFELRRTPLGGVLRERALPRCSRNRAERGIVQGDGPDGIVAVL